MTFNIGDEVVFINDYRPTVRRKVIPKGTNGRVFFTNFNHTGIIVNLYSLNGRRRIQKSVVIQHAALPTLLIKKHKMNGGNRD